MSTVFYKCCIYYLENMLNEAEISVFSYGLDGSTNEKSRCVG